MNTRSFLLKLLFTAFFALPVAQVAARMAWEMDLNLTAEQLERARERIERRRMRREARRMRARWQAAGTRNSKGL